MLPFNGMGADLLEISDRVEYPVVLFAEKIFKPCFEG